MRGKGSPKRVGEVEFWRKEHIDLVSEEVKELVYREFYSKDMFIYCDSSLQTNKGMMGVSCSYVHNGSIQVKRKLVYPSYDCRKQNLYGELESLIFALTHFSKYLSKECSIVTIYSDIQDIEVIIQGQAIFKKYPSITKIQKKLIQLYKLKQHQHSYLQIKIQYLSIDLRKHNPFMNSSHNAANQMLK